MLERAHLLHLVPAWWLALAGSKLACHLLLIMSLFQISQLLIVRTLFMWELLASKKAHPRLLTAIVVYVQRGSLAILQIVSLAQLRNSVCLVGLLEPMALGYLGGMLVLSREMPLRVYRPAIWGVVHHTQLFQMDLSRMLVLVARKALEILNGSGGVLVYTYWG